jgi:hypothetical protein
LYRVPSGARAQMLEWIHDAVDRELALDVPRRHPAPRYVGLKQGGFAVNQKINSNCGNYPWPWRPNATMVGP